LQSSSLMLILFSSIGIRWKLADCVANVSEDHTTSTIKAKVRNVENL
jgi:hypothetical protein